jgi:biopolymer transport protein ExbD
LGQTQDRVVLISSAADVRYEHVVRVLDIIKQSGAKSLSLVPRKKDA